MTDIHDNLPPIAIPFFQMGDWIILAVLIITGFVFWLLRRKKEKPIRAEKKQVKRIPFSWKKEMQKLKKIAKKEDWKTFSFEASALLKRILEMRFSQNFPDRTGEETWKSPLFSQSEKEKLQTFFSVADPVKFSNTADQKVLAEEIFTILEYFYSQKDNGISAS